MSRLDSIDPARAIDSIVIPSTLTMSALLASSFVGRVTAFKATKVQVRVSMRADAFDAFSRARGANRVARAVRRDGCVAAYRAPRAR